MTANATHNDKPISEPTEDRFGIDPFARTLAGSIKKIAGPEGTVLALHGPWGSGKSSAVNLILYHLKDAVAAGDIVTINFASWWFRGEEALALAFFSELYAGLGAPLGKRFKKALKKIGTRVLRAGPVVGAGVDAAGGVGLGSLASSAMNWLSGVIPQGDTIEKLHAELSTTLAKQGKRFLIVIDDIDRLAPDEALLIFRLVKSVGRLPNVIYLLVFDRILAEAIIAEKYPSEGPHYLEKIIQAGFDLPEPRPDDLRSQALQLIGNICGTPAEADLTRFMNVFYDVVAPEIRTPRDLNRLANVLSVTWPAVGGDVDRADFIGLETLRMLRPHIYRALRGNKNRVCGSSASGMSRSGREQSGEYDRIFLSVEPEEDRDRLRRGLMRIFPRLEAIWSNVHYDGDEEWARQRRACSKAHFDSYFRLTVGDNILPREEVERLVSRASDRGFVIAALRDALAVTRSSGGTKAALILEELNLHADSVPDDAVEPLLAAIFQIADELDVEADAAKAFDIGDNDLRIIWLVRRLTLKRHDLAKRSSLFLAACEAAALGWLVRFSQSAHRDYHPTDGKPPEPESECLTTAADAAQLCAKALQRLRESAQSGELAAHAKLPYLLYIWSDLASDDGAEVRQWTSAQLDRDDMIVRFARAFTSHGWSHSISDTVSRRTTLANVSGSERIIDKDRFRSRVEEVLAGGKLSDKDTAAVSEFLGAWRRHDENPRRF